MKTFKDYIVEFDTPQIYCDMDGVIADFVKFTSSHLGHPFKDEYWKDLPDDLFWQLPLMPDAKNRTKTSSQRVSMVRLVHQKTEYML